MSVRASLTLSSDERLLSIVQASGREYARAIGVPEPDGERLVGALDTAVRFVCERAYPGDSAGEIEVVLEPAERGIVAAVHDWGRPLTSAEGADVRVDLGPGVEQLRLINLGADGKRLTFVLRTSHRADVLAGVADAPAPVVAAVADAIGMRAARPEDAEPIAQLLYENYALSYVHPDFYRPLWLREEIAAGRVLSAVAEHGGEIVAHHALMPATDGAVAETGVAVVAPAYRGLGIFGRLGERTLAQARALDLAAVYGRAVTRHPFSQRAERAHGYRETALLLAASPAKEGGRMALMLAYVPLRAAPRRPALPARHRERLLETYAELGLWPSPPASAGGGETALAVWRRTDVATATVTIRGWNGDQADAVRGAVRMLLAEHFDALYADVDLEATAGVDAAVESLRDLGFSYAGLRLHGPGDHDHLRLQRLNCTDPELDAIATASPAGAALRDYVLADLAAD
jgi:N-acetylglutamate synthase-like GNAT family acetyltransferase